MRWLRAVFLVIALLAAALWLTSALAAGIAKFIAGIFLVLFLISLFLRGRDTRKL
ncbi:MAG TPA: hypothetical protein VK530_02875 [Candidatus Acidoferrum sp.]|nr:hypothetical protein [Candidatus Acidoferrum sp.]